MKAVAMAPMAFLLCVFFLLASVTDVSALSSKYCSSMNTGSNFVKEMNNFNSNGACFQVCNANYAFAIVQGKSCWCSNYVPAETTSTDDCDEGCPGYPQETCGNSDENLFGYIALSRAPSGTAGSTGSKATSSADDSDSSTVSKSTESPSPVTVFQTVTASPPVRVSSETSTSAASSSSASSTSSTSSPSSSSSTLSTSVVKTAESSSSSSWSPTPITSLVTVTGKVSTVTITPAAPPPIEEKASSALPAGAIAGIAIGSAAALGIMGAAFFFIWRCIQARRREAAAAALYKEDSSGSGPRRHASRTSQMSLMAGSRYPYGDKMPPIQTSGLDGIPYVNNGSPEMSSVPSNRASYPRLTDQRLEPHVLFAGHDNSSRVSVPSLKDDQDYSRRVLRLANPDE